MIVVVVPEDSRSGTETEVREECSHKGTSNIKSVSLKEKQKSLYSSRKRKSWNRDKRGERSLWEKGLGPC